MMCLHMGLFLSIVLHTTCLFNQETRIFQSNLKMFIDYFLPFIFSVLVFWDPNDLNVGPSGWVFFLFFPLPFPFAISAFFYSLLYLFFCSTIFQILNFYLGCLSLNLQGLILFFVLFCLFVLWISFLFGIMFLFCGCSVFSYFSETNEDFFKKSILLSTWSFSPPVTFTYLLEAFLR